MTHTITDARGESIPVTIHRDRRLKKSARWQREPDGSILLRVPYTFPKRDIPALLRDIQAQVRRQARRRAPRTDDDLQQRAEYINRTCFGGQISWEGIRWVSNMTQRLGSCTTSGSTQWQIRISDRIREWPRWVVDYVIAHELAHCLHPNHSPEFWDLLNRSYPLTERARGFIRGVAFARGLDGLDDADSED